MPIIKFIKEKKEIEVPRGANLRKAALEAGINLYQGINGFGGFHQQGLQLSRPGPVRHVPRAD